MEETRFWRLAAKYFAGEASEREIEALRACIESDPIRRDQFADAAQAWGREGRRDVVQPDALAAWNELERRIEREETGSVVRPGSMRADKLDRPARQPRTTARRRLGLAAGGVMVVLVALIATLLWSDPQGTVISTRRGERITLDLADGTRVHLNAESRLSHAGFSGSGPREVHLEGEAFFEVAPDAQRPFLVRTHEGVIRVVGTAFNVEAYADHEEVSVAVAEGAVALLVKESSQTSAEDTVVLRPHQIGVMTGERLQALYRDVDITSRLAWREGRLVFEDAPFPEVARRLERWFDLEIDSSSLDSVDRLNATFDSGSASDVINDIALALGLQYEQDGDKVRFYRQQSAAPVHGHQSAAAPDPEPPR